VRLGLLLSEIGGANNVQVTEQEMNRLIIQAASQYEGKDRETFIRYIQQEPMAAAQLRAPLYEDKVVDFLFGKAEISDRSATREQLEADLESEEGHVHGPGCGHDHAHAEKPKKGKAKAASKPQPEEPAKGPVEKKSGKPKPAKPLKEAAVAEAPAAKSSAKKPAAKKPAKKA
jgi:trigger factor